jgi:predicted unusual protein kinase regulating ubiquinone biosynthesis (AarF/ABC1/UbiB family)/nucleotide-binding universal stress UspA family protein
MVGTDRSETAEQAVRWAAGFAERFDAELHVVQVIMPRDGNSHGAPADLSSLTSDLTSHARSIGGHRARGKVVFDDDPAMAIVRAANEEHADVLVVGNAGMAGRRQFLLGNVPNRISHNARCTVIIVNTGAADGKATSRLADEAETSNGNGAHSGPVARGAAIAAVLARHGVRELFDRSEDDGSEARRRQAKRLRAALEELGPTFAKLGQILSTRPDLLPPEFVEELSQLRDRVAPLSESDVVRVMEQDLGVPWEDVLEAIEATPLAAGTIGQVHRAALATGDRVVVKVQRPEARALITQDLALLKLATETVGSTAAVQRRIDLPAAFEHLSTSLQQELDFNREAANAERLRAALAGFSRLGVPATHPGFSTSRLLIMQDVAGGSLDTVPAHLRPETARQFLESFYKQILIDGFFHADPHPGNLMWQPAEERLYFLDLGMVGEVNPETRELLILLLMAFWQEDAGLLTDAILTLSKSTDRSDLDVPAFSADLQALMARVRGAQIKDIQLGVVLQDMLDLAFKHRVPVPASLALTVKALAQMQSAAAQLDPSVDPFEVAGKFITRSAMRHVLTKADPKMLFYEGQKLKFRGLRLLEAVERLVGARPGDKLEVSIRGTSLEETIWMVGRVVSLGVIGGFALLASAITASSNGSSRWSVAFGVAGAAAIVALILGVVRARRPRV